MFPAMNREGMMGALSHYVFDYVTEGLALGFYRGHKFGEKMKKATKKNAKN